MRVCPFCAEEIQDAAVVCKHCKRDLPPAAQTSAERSSPSATPPRTTESKAPSTKKKSSVAALLLVLVLLIVIVMSQSNDSSSSPAASSIASAVTVPAVFRLASDGEITIPAGSVQHFDWEAPQDKPNCRISGHIAVTAGGSKDVEVAIMPGDDFQNFVNGHAFKQYFQEQRTSAVTLDVTTGNAGPLVVAISNGFSVVSEKKVNLTGLQAVCR